MWFSQSLIIINLLQLHVCFYHLSQGLFARPNTILGVTCDGQPSHPGQIAILLPVVKL